MCFGNHAGPGPDWWCCVSDADQLTPIPRAKPEIIREFSVIFAHERACSTVHSIVPAANRLCLDHVNCHVNQPARVILTVLINDAVSNNHARSPVRQPADHWGCYMLKLTPLDISDLYAFVFGTRL